MRDVELPVAAQVPAKRLLVARVPAPAEIRRERQPLAHVRLVVGVDGGNDARFRVVGGRLQRPAVADVVVDVRFGAVDARLADVDVVAGGGANEGVVDERLQLLPVHVVGGAVPEEAILQARRLPADLVVVERVGRVGLRNPGGVARLRVTGVAAAVTEALSPVGIHHRVVGDLIVDAEPAVPVAVRAKLDVARSGIVVGELGVGRVVAGVGAKMHHARLDVEPVGDIEIDIGELGRLPVLRALGVGVPLARRERRLGQAVVRQRGLKRRTLVLQSRHDVAVVEVLIEGLLPVRAHEPVQATAGLRREPQLIGKAPRVDVVGVVLQRHLAAGKCAGAVIGIIEAGIALLGAGIARRGCVARTGIEVLLVLRVLVQLAPLLVPVGAREHQVPDTDVTVDVKIEHVCLEQVLFRAEALHRARRQLGKLVPRTEGVLALEAERQHGAPAFAKYRFQRSATAFGVLAVVVVPRPLGVVRDGPVDPGAGHQLIVDEAAMGVAVGREPQAEHAVDEGRVQKPLVGPILLRVLNLAAVEVDAGAEGIHIGLVGDVADRARHRAGPEGRALRAVQHLDALDVVEVQIRLRAVVAHRHVVDKETGRGGVRVIGVAAVGDPAHDEQLRTRACADVGHRR